MNSNLSDAGLMHLAGLRKLDTLSIYGGEFTDIGLASLEQMTGLTRLQLFGDHRFSRPAVSHLFQTLRELNYLQTGVVFPGEKALRERVLAGSHVTSPGATTVGR